MIITIDGPAAAGKGTLASAIAQKYKYAYFDTGMIYRAVGLQMLLHNKDLNDETSAIEYASNLTFPLMMELSKNPDFRSAKGGQAASIVSAIKKVRAELLTMQQNFALNPVFADDSKANGVVYDGRDTGTVVCPTAELKLFITASPEVRAKRRFAEFQQKGSSLTYEEVLADIIARDERDTNRADAPLKPAKDAIIIDTSDLSITEVFTQVDKIIKARQELKKTKKDVAAGLIMCDGLMLIAQRKHGKSLEYKWEFPGGKLEEGETLEECLAREMMEEMGLKVYVRDAFVVSSYDYDFGTIILHSFWATCKSKDIPLVLEHEQYKWVNPRDLPNYDFAPADKPIIEAILGLLPNLPEY